jgi:hypothetical protein
MPRRWRRVGLRFGRQQPGTIGGDQLLRQLHVPLDDLVLFVRPDMIVVEPRRKVTDLVDDRVDRRASASTSTVIAALPSGRGPRNPRAGQS